MRVLFSTRRIFVAVLVIGFFALAARNVVDPDVWWHLKTGEWIVVHRAVPHTDPFSYTRAGQPWVAHEWLSDLLIYAIYRASGWAGLIVIFAAFVASAFLLLYLRAGRNPYVAGVVTLVGAWATAPLWGVRPQTLSLLLTSLWLLILERSERDSKLLWRTLPLTLLWVNLHAGFALGLALVALFLAGETLERILDTGSAKGNFVRLRTLAFVLVIGLFLVPLNPNGARMYSYPIETLRSRGIQSYIAEWASPNFHRPEYWPFLALLLATAAAMAWSSTRPRLRDLLLVVASTFAALSSVRLIPFFVLVAVPIIGKAVSESVQARRSMRRLTLPYAVILNALALLGMFTFATLHASQVVRHQPQSEAESFPVTAISYLQAHPPANPIFNDYDWGGYLIWKLCLESRVFVDGRADLYEEDFLRQYADTYQLRADWRQALMQWQIKTVIVASGSALAVALRTDSGWSMQYDDRNTAIFCRTDGDGTNRAAPP